MRTLYAAVGAACLAGISGFQQDGESKKRILRDVDLVGSWIYDDLNAGFAQAKKAGKPMLVVFR